MGSSRRCQISSNYCREKRIAYEKEYGVDKEEYFKLFNADKARFIAQGCSEELAYKLACGSAQYREDKRLGLSTD